eukprot:TRINITY_DN17221_c0_g1_i1.p1 TRINITY_DN17221_c0_g1~~TRINITY_DN17221_c0_g1_i1.p1  ORF type:complete len:357 (+),score=73.90 TRINITY_DN17221_c0_g1_i1:55-1071(+)
MYQENYNQGLTTEGVDEEYFEGYGDVSVHATMINDKPRMDAYQEAAKTCAGKIVVDVGAGTGVLGMMAARCGAEHVYLVEASPMARLLPKIVAKNNLTNKITIIHKKVEQLTLDDIGGRHADIILSEWMGFYLVHESMLNSVLWARDNLLNKNIEPWQMLPNKANIVAATSNLNSHIDERVNTWKDVAGFDMSELMEISFQGVVSEPLVEVIPDSKMTSGGQVIASFDLTTVRLIDLVSISQTLKFTTNNQPTSAVTIWFDVFFPNTTLSTSPAAPPTHWKQTTILLPVSNPIPANSSLSVAFSIDQDLSDNHRCYSLSVELQEADDARELLLQALSK